MTQNSPEKSWNLILQFLGQPCYLVQSAGTINKTTNCKNKIWGSNLTRNTIETSSQLRFTIQCLQKLKSKFVFIIFAFFCSHFEAAITKIFNKYKKTSPEKVLETLNLFPKAEFSEKEEIH